MIGTETRRVRMDALNPEAVLSLMSTSGLIGHGGGGFPTATKIAAARGRRPELIVNGCDGEPLVAKDTYLLRQVPHLVADGIAVVQSLLRPQRTLLAVHAGSAAAQAADRVVAAVPGRLEVLPVPPRYVSSEASALASLAAGREARPVDHERPLTDGFPTARRRPVVVLNVETVARVAALVIRGEATHTRLLSVAGDVRSPMVVEVDIRTRIAEVVALAGTHGSRRAVLIGGYGGRWFDYDAIAESRITDLGRDIGAGLMMVQGDGCPLTRVADILDYLAGESAGQCGPCMFGLPAVAADWRELLVPGRSVAAQARLRQRLPMIRGRGACAHPDGAVTMAATALEVFADDVRAHAQGACVAGRTLVGANR